SGAGLYASDPHLEVNRLPAIWYEVVGTLPGGDFRTGVTVPGVPGLVMGRTRAIAAGFTYGFADTIDFVIEEVRDGRYRRGNEWRPLGERRETVRRKKAPAVEVALFETEAGVLELPDGATRVEDGLWLARSWTCRREGGAASLEAILDLWAAPDVERAAEAASSRSPRSGSSREGSAGWRRSCRDSSRGGAARRACCRSEGGSRATSGMAPSRRPASRESSTRPTGSSSPRTTPATASGSPSASPSRWGTTGPTACASSSPNGGQEGTP
ncbi:MAG: penicillin acylase family protein, partial [Thermoanaerobaculia bacterium]|nr:penicillin acylase family protein [Thermoanaerobaculia bacterium]